MPAIDAYQPILLDGRAGRVEARWYPAAGARAAAILFGGVGGGFDTPAGHLYVRLARHLPRHGVAVLRVRFREAGDLAGCVADVLAGIEWLVPQGLWHLGLVGHSFGGAVAITAAAERPAFVATVVALATQSFGTDAVSRLDDRPLLLVHGTDDEVLPPTCSIQVYRRAGARTQLQLLDGAHHALEEAADEVYRLAHGWLVEHLVGGAAAMHP